MWITQALKRLYINRVFFAFNMQVSSFNWTPFFAWCCIVSKFRSVHLHCERLLAASKVPWRNRIPLEHKERIVRWFEDQEEDYLVIADTLGVNRSTARGIVDLWPQGGKDIRQDTVSGETGKAPSCRQKQTWCTEQVSRLHNLVYKPYRGVPLCVC